jgi:hypothetical protein
MLKELQDHVLNWNNLLVIHTYTQPSTNINNVGVLLWNTTWKVKQNAEVNCSYENRQGKMDRRNGKGRVHKWNEPENKQTNEVLH